MNYKDRQINSFFACIREKLLSLRDKRRERIERDYRINQYRHWFYVNHGWKPSKKEAMRELEFDDFINKKFDRSAGSVIFPMFVRTN